MLQTNRTAVPALPVDHVERPRLLDAMDHAIERPLTLVAAPAGTGKTALVSAWARSGRAPGPVAWAALDGGAVDRRDFWRLAGDACARAVGLRAPSRRATADTLLGGFARRMHDRDEPLVLVLDDFHELAAPGVDDDLGALLAHPPAALRLVLVTRRDPPLRLARLRVAGTMAELRAADLAFSATEAAELLDRAGVQLTAADAGALWRRTEGWAAGLRLAALGLRDHPDPPAFVRAFAGNDDAVADYLLTEVLALLGDRTRDFVVRTALPDAVCGDLADALTGDDDGERMLHDLAHAGAMLAPVGADAGWWRYHPLLRDLLRAELRHAHATELPALHRAAAGWLAAHDRLGPAVTHAAAGGEVELAAGALADAWVDAYVEGDFAAVGELVRRLPGEAGAGDAELALAAAIVHLEAGELDAGDAALARARDGLPPPRRDFAAALAAVVLRRGRLRGEPRAALADARAILAGAPPPTTAGALALVSLGIAELWTGEHERAAAELEAGRAAGARSGHGYLEALALAHLAADDAARGRHVHAAARAAEAVDILERRGWTDTAAAAAAYVVRGGVEVLWDELDEAEADLGRAELAIQTGPEPWLRTALALWRAQLLAARGQPDAALATIRLESYERAGQADLPAEAGALDALEALLLADLGEQAEAAARLEAGLDGGGAEEHRVALARLRLADGRPDAALELLAGTPGAVGATRVQALAVEAVARDALLEHDAASAALERALDVAEPRGLRRPVLELGGALRPVLRRLVDRETAHRALARELLDALERRQAGGPGRARLREPLSDREIAVLRCLPTMLSNQEIASELFISVNTLKTHLKQIYRKLDATSRREAVERARDLYLLSPGH